MGSRKYAIRLLGAAVAAASAVLLAGCASGGVGHDIGMPSQSGAAVVAPTGV